MVRALSFLTVILLTTQSALAVKCQYGSRSGRDAIQNSIITDESLARAENQILPNIPMGKHLSRIPDRYRNIVLNDQDISISTVDQQATKSQSYWGKQLSEQDIQYYQSHGFDWVSFQELNNQAHQIWNDLKKCNQANLQDLRANYFSIKLCPNPADGKALLIRMQNFTTNYFQFIDTSRLYYKNASPLPRYLQEPELVIPAQHPLLYQTGLQLWAVMLNLAVEKPRVDAFGNHGALSELYMQMTAGESLGYYGDGHRNWAKDQYNLALILLGQDADCAALGLWPAVNRTLLYMEDFTHNFSGAIDSIFSNGLKKFEKSCGHLSVRASRAVVGTYGGYAVAHTFESRRLFLSYFPELKESQAMLKLVKKDTKVVPFEKLVCD